MEILNKEVVETTMKKFSEELEKSVSLVFFTQESSRLVLTEHLKRQEYLFCKETKQLLEEVSSFSDKLTLTIYDFVSETHKCKQ